MDRLHQEGEASVREGGAASRLTGRAWTVTAELDYSRLRKYFLEFLRSRLCQTAVPDAGARVEELLIKLRRPPGMGFAQWSATLVESYRKVQRSLIRARARAKPAKEEKVEPKTERRTASEPHSEPASPGSPGGRARRSPTTSSPAHGRVPGPEEPQQADQPEQGDGHHYDAVPQEDPDGEGDGQDWTSWYNRWTPEQWHEWLKETKDKEADEESDEELGRAGDGRDRGAPRRAVGLASSSTSQPSCFGEACSSSFSSKLLEVPPHRERPA